MDKKLELSARQKQANDTKRRIYNTAMRLFAEDDIDNVQIMDICHMAHVSIGSFYNYYNSKQDLIMSSYPSFDDYVDSCIDPESYEYALDGVFALLHIQTVGAASAGANMYAQSLRTQLKNEGKYVVEPERAMNRYMLELISLAIYNGELEPGPKADADSIAATVLRISRGVLFDWAMRRGPYDVHNMILSEVGFYLERFIVIDYKLEDRLDSIFSKL